MIAHTVDEKKSNVAVQLVRFEHFARAHCISSKDVFKGACSVEPAIFVYLKDYIACSTQVNEVGVSFESRHQQ